MLRQSNIVAIAILIIATGFQPIEALAKKHCLYGKCSYYSDPHLIPFPNSFGGPQSQYWCKNPGWELFITNAHVSIFVLVGASPFLIIDYVLIFPGSPPCMVIGSSGSSPVCAGGTPATSVTLTPGHTWNHYHNTQCIIVQIEKWSIYYSVHIYESFALIGSSSGLCRKPNCKGETPWPLPLPVIPEICDIFIDAAKKRAMGEIEPNMINMARVSCVTDIQMTFDPRFARTALALVLQDSAESLLDCGDARSVLAKADTLANEATLEATKRTNELLSNTTRLCDDNKQCLQLIKDYEN